MAVLEGSEGAVAATLGISSAAALAFLMFNLFSPPCFAAIGAMNAELKSKKWLLGGLGLQLSIGYTVGFLVYFFGTLFSGHSFAHAWMPAVGWSVVIAIVAIVTLLVLRARAEKNTPSAPTRTASFIGG